MLSSDLLQQVEMAARSSPDFQVILSPNFLSSAQNELLFFYKPESFLGETDTKFTRINRMVIQKLGSFSTSVDGIILLGGPFLAQARIMDRHYGFINRLSRTASELVSPEDRSRMCEHLSLDLQEYRILGGHQFLEVFPAFDDERLNDFWLSKPSQKLRSGYYFQSFEVEQQKIILINGFHPQQLSHFTRSGRKIVLFLLHSDTPWAVLKNELAGDTFPDRALPGSIRGEIFSHQTDYHARDMSISRNYVHLSAGPFEALYEIQNFLSAIPDLHLDIHTTGIGRRLVKAGSQQLVDLAVQNPMVCKDEETADLFSSTENMDTDAAVAFYQRYVQLDR